MAELTITIPDELAERLQPLKDQLLELLSQLLESDTFPQSIEEEETSSNPEYWAVYQEILDFLIQRPTPTQISDFKVSPTAQKRLQTLLEKNRESTLTSAETAELDVYEQLEHLMILLKIKAK